MMKRFFSNRELVMVIGLANAAMPALGASEDLMLEEIIVTAQKRAQSIQDVPISVSAVSGDKIAETGMNNLEDLSAYVPNLNISEGGETTNIFMRGLGSGVNFGFEQSVGMYIDGVYYGRDRQYRSPFLDLERVEVLRGPQGTLFGKNTIAGAINITTAKPTDELEGSVTAEYDPKYHGENLTAILSGPLSDTLGGRIAVKSASSDGFLDNTFTGEEVAGEDELVVRTTFVWRPSDDWEITAKMEKASFDVDGRNTQISDATSSALIALYEAADPEFDSILNGYTSKSEEEAETNSENYSLTVNYDLNGYSLTSITAYSGYDFYDSQDADYTPLVVIPQTFDQEFNQWSQEIRLASPLNDTFDYIVGMYYQSNDLEHTRLTNANVAPLGIAAPPVARITLFDQDSDSFAVFAQGTWHLSESWHLTGGLRYTKEEKTASQIVDFTTYDTFNIIDADEDPVAYATASAVWSLFGSYAHSFEDIDRNEEDVSPMLNLQWDVTSNVMLYASASRGFKGGGFNPSDVVGNNFEFDEEKAKSFEIGGKTTLLDGAAQFNFAVFNTDYEGLQVSSFNGVVFSVSNAAEASTRGVELEGVWRLTEGLTINSSLAWLDAQYDNFDTAACPAGSALGCTQDLAGKDLTFAPEITANLGVEHVMPLAGDLELRTRLDLNYSDDYQIQQDQDPADHVDSYTMVNANVGLINTRNNWSLALVGKNLTDEDHRTYSFDVPVQTGTHAGFITPPRTVAIRATFNY